MNYENRYERHAWPPSAAFVYKPPVLETLVASFDVSLRSLCEKEDLSETGTPKNGLSGKPFVQLPSSDNDSVGFLHVVCSSGHYTHLFLACDVRSDCLQHDPLGQSNGSDTLMALCTSILGTLFTCRNGVGRVPYSLVCDHSQDCLDSSDEDFCVYPSCSSSWQFECENRQVGHKKSW